MNPEKKTTWTLTPLGWGNRVFYRVQRVIALPILRLFFHFRVTGASIPMRGPFILAANHESLMDPVVLQAAVKRRLRYLMTSDYYFKPLLNRYSRIMRTIPVMEGRFNREAIRDALQVLAAGEPIGVFPQGELQSEGSYDQGMRGTALVALKSGAPLYPARLRGTGRAFPKGALFLRPAALEVRIGDPLVLDDPSRKRSASRHQRLKEITKELMARIEDL